MRSALDPLPRSLSIRSLAILVTMLVAGIAISVQEYLESGRNLPRASTVHASEAAHLALPRSAADAPRQTSAPTSFEIEAAAARDESPCERSAESEPVPSSSAGVWVPEGTSTGS